MTDSWEHAPVPATVPVLPVADLARSLAWLSGLPNPEDAPPGEVTDSVEARGFMAEGTGVPSLDRLLPIVAETEAKWLARRAATELAVDSGRRFIRYNNLLLPEQTDGQAINAPLDLNAALGQIAGLLDPAAAQTDPLAPALAKIAARGGSGAAVTRMDMAPDLSRVRVGIGLWVRGPQGWFEYGSRTAEVGPNDVPPAAAAGLENDPQVQSVFNFADALGLGAVTAEMRRWVSLAKYCPAASGRGPSEASAAWSWSKMRIRSRSDPAVISRPPSLPMAIRAAAPPGTLPCVRSRSRSTARSRPSIIRSASSA